MAIIYAVGMLIVIGTLSVGSIKQVSYPMIAAVRGVEIPGTFVERLENYLLLAWIPVVFDTLMLLLYGAAQTLMRLAAHTDHRPQVVGLVPFLFIGATLLDRQQELETVANLLSWLGLGFSLGLVPFCLFIVWIRRKDA
jgi:spore germination protein